MLRRFAAAAVALTVAFPAAAEERFIAIGTGGVTGVYYPAGSRICRILNAARDALGLRCAVEPSGGSVSNLEAMRAGSLEFGIVQSDLQHHAFRGSGRFEGRPMPELRAVLSLHPEHFTLLARADSGISGFGDLAGHSVNIGNSGSGQRATMEVVMRAFGLAPEDFAQAAEFRGSEMAAALCDGRIEAMVYIVGHPNPAIREATEGCAAALVPVTGPPVDALVADHSYYERGRVPGGLYPGATEPVETLGLRATLVATTAVPDEIVHDLVATLIGEIDTFRALHPAFARLDPAEMAREGHAAPLHPGARRAFREAGLID